MMSSLMSQAAARRSNQISVGDQGGDFAPSVMAAAHEALGLLVERFGIEGKARTSLGTALRIQHVRECFGLASWKRRGLFPRVRMPIVTSRDKASMRPCGGLLRPLLLTGHLQFARPTCRQFRVSRLAAEGKHHLTSARLTKYRVFARWLQPGSLCPRPAQPLVILTFSTQERTHVCRRLR